MFNEDQHESQDTEGEPQKVEEIIQLQEGAELNDGVMLILEKIIEILKEDKTERLSSLGVVERSKLMKIVKIVDHIIGEIQARDITKSNKLIYARAFVVSNIVDMIKPKIEKKEPWWKRRLEGQVKKKWRKVLKVHIRNNF